MKIQMKIPLFLIGDIDAKNAAFVLRGLASGKESLLILCSNGGELGFASAIHDEIRNHPEVAVRASGMCHSAAVFVLMAAEKRVATPNTSFQVHKCVVEGQVGEAERAEAERVNTLLRDLLVERTNLTREQSEELMQRGEYFGVEKALEIGLIHEIVNR